VLLAAGSGGCAPTLDGELAQWPLEGLPWLDMSSGCMTFAAAESIGVLAL
jgi:hypothetical protein